MIQDKLTFFVQSAARWIPDMLPRSYFTGALAILAQQPEKAPLIAVLKLLVEKRTRESIPASG